ncbi:MAG: YggS family pyridoxal phosphate-dependent enzyme [Actinomycetota bacterium]
MIASPEELAANLREVRARIEAAAARAGRAASEVRLIAVTKTMPAEAVTWARELGVADLGENYVGELADKRPLAPDATWHFIGTLQSHTAHRVAEDAHVVHSAVPGRAVERLARRAAERGRTIPVLIQVDQAGRGTGVEPRDIERAAAELAAIEGVQPVGLMTLPPPPERPGDSRPFFAELRAMGEHLREGLPELRELSMGMSLDYEIAVEEGASMVRVGTALFGARPSRPGN